MKSTLQVLPHQFVGRTAAGIKDVVGEGCVSCSLVKGGIDIKPEGMELCSEATPASEFGSRSSWSRKRGCRFGRCRKNLLIIAIYCLHTYCTRTLNGGKVLTPRRLATYYAPYRSSVQERVGIKTGTLITKRKPVVPKHLVTKQHTNSLRPPPSPANAKLNTPSAVSARKR